MTTARDVIRSAIEEIGEYSPGETLTAADGERGLEVLNDMLSMWSNENLACFAMLTQTFPLVVGQGAYTIGPAAADITSVRPLKIEQAWQTDLQGSRLPIDIVTQDRWNQRVNAIVEASVQTRLFYDPQNPLGIINLWPMPTQVWTVGFTSYLQFTRFANLTDPVLLPNGYEGALKRNLAVEIAPFFNRNPLPITIALASEYKGRLKAKNITLDVASFDPAIVGRGSYNVFTDTGG